MKAKLIGFGALTLFFLTGFFFIQTLQIIDRQVPTAWVEDHRADCAVVLTGGVGRVREGFAMLSQGLVQKLIVSGVYEHARLREIFPEWPYYGELDEKDVILEKRSRTTYGNAQQSLPLVEALNCRDIVVVTSRLHMSRAYKTFRAVYPEGYPIYQRSVVQHSWPPKTMDLMIEGVKSLFYGLWVF